MNSLAWQCFAALCAFMVAWNVLVHLYATERLTFKWTMRCMTVAALFAFGLAGMAHAQYQNTITKGVYDLTANVKAGLNVWKTLPGTQGCASPGSMSFGGHLYYCVGADGNPWKYDRRTKTWAIDTRLNATGMSELAVRNVNAMYALWTSGDCSAPDKKLWYWTPSAGWNYPGGTYPAGTQKCLSHVSVAGDGFLVGITHASGELWYSRDGGQTWVSWGYGFAYVHMWSENAGCAVTTSGAVETLGLNNQLSNLGGNFVGCMYGDQPFVLMAWDASGNVSMVDEQNGAWDTVSGLKASHIAGFNKLMVVALDQSNHPFHWNIMARSITGTAAGTWTGGCPGPGSTCHPTTQHKATVKVWFSSGHGINYSKPATVQQVTWNQPINASFIDINPGCDPLFGVPTEVECQVESSGGEECLQSDAGIGNMPNAPDPTREGISHDYQSAVSYVNRRGPTLLFASPNGTEVWFGEEQLNFTDACFPGSFPTCPGPNPFPLEVYSVGGFGSTNVEYQLDTYQTLNPFLSEEDWDNGGIGGTVQCLGDQITWGTEGNFDDPNFVPTCD